MKQNNKTFEHDIKRAEKITLIISWIGVLSAFGIIAFSIWGI